MGGEPPMLSKWREGRETVMRTGLTGGEIIGGETYPVSSAANVSSAYCVELNDVKSFSAESISSCVPAGVNIGGDVPPGNSAQCNGDDGVSETWVGLCGGSSDKE